MLARKTGFPRRRSALRRSSSKDCFVRTVAPLGRPNTALSGEGRGSRAGADFVRCNDEMDSSCDLVGI